MNRIITLAVAVALGAAIATALAVGCRSEAERQPATELTAPRDALGEDLMVALAQAKNFHHKADVYLRDARLDLAIDSVRQVFSIPFPPGAPEAEDVMLDARARLAKLLVTKGDVARAMEVAVAGVGAATRDSFFLANLYTVRGEVWEAKAIQLDESGSIEEAKGARRQAISDFDHAIKINEALLKRLARERP